MDSFAYRLVVITHGDMEPLWRTLEAFREHVTPEPADTMVFYDGRGASKTLLPDAQWFFSGGSLGFCGNTARAWERSSREGPKFVWWQEQDFLIEKFVDLRDLAFVLDWDWKLAQVALMRDAVNEAEKAAGGLYESRPGEYQKVETIPQSPDPWGRWLQGPWEWKTHRSYMTSNPSLMRREFMRGNPWLHDGQPFCEGRFGIQLLERGYKFGVWGSGEPWCRHIGRRTGWGY